jgi:hypothetical protein
VWVCMCVGVRTQKRSERYIKHADAAIYMYIPVQERDQAT